MDPSKSEYYSNFLTNNKPIEINHNENEQQPISQITYDLFIKQTKEELFKNFFKNKTEITTEKANQNKKSTRKSAAKEKIKIPKEILNQTTKNHVIDKKKKKELFEEIIKTNSNSLRSNPFVQEQKKQQEEEEREKKFESHNLEAYSAANIHLENEVEIKRNLLEKKHKDIILSNLPQILDTINNLIGENNEDGNKNFYFVKNKYEKILSEYS